MNTTNVAIINGSPPFFTKPSNTFPEAFKKVLRSLPARIALGGNFFKLDFNKLAIWTNIISSRCRPIRL